MLDNQWKHGEVSFVLPQLDPIILSNHGLKPIVLVLDADVGPEVVLLITEPQENLQDFEGCSLTGLELKTGLVATSFGPVFWLLFHFPNLATGKEVTYENSIDPKDQEQLSIYKQLADQKYWHVIIADDVGKVCNFLEFLNGFALSEAIGQAEKASANTETIDFQAAKAAYEKEYSIDQLLPASAVQDLSNSPEHLQKGYPKYSPTYFFPDPRVDLAWTEGELSDSRPFLAQIWAEPQMTLCTLYFSTEGIENASPTLLQDIVDCTAALTLNRDKYAAEFNSETNIEAKTFVDDAGNSMWAVTVVMRDENGNYAKLNTPGRAYDKIPAIPIREIKLAMAITKRLSEHGHEVFDLHLINISDRLYSVLLQTLIHLRTDTVPDEYQRDCLKLNPGESACIKTYDGWMFDWENEEIVMLDDSSERLFMQFFIKKGHVYRVEKKFIPQLCRDGWYCEGRYVVPYRFDMNPTP